MRNLFDWSYPPGAANDTNAPWNQDEGLCEVCGKPIDDCICPECPECGAQGDPVCYEKHGLVITEEQKTSKEHAERQAKEDDEQRCAWEMRMEEMCIDHEAEESP